MVVLNQLKLVWYGFTGQVPEPNSGVNQPSVKEYPFAWIADRRYIVKRDRYDLL